MPYPAQDGYGVCLELHPGATPETKPATSQAVGDVAACHGHMGRQPFQDCHQCRTVRLARGKPSEHDQKFGTGYWSIS
jgi:hypothetical protein